MLRAHGCNNTQALSDACMHLSRFDVLTLMSVYQLMHIWAGCSGGKHLLLHSTEAVESALHFAQAHPTMINHLSSIV